MPAPVVRAVLGGLARRRVQTVVIAVVLLISTGSAVLALALLADSDAPFDHAFADRSGAHVTAAMDTSTVTPTQLAATAALPQVIAAAGPFPQTHVGDACTPVVVRLGGANGIPLEAMTVVGRDSPSGPVDQVALVAGRWAQRPGEIVLQFGYMGGHVPVASTLTVTGLPGTPHLSVVGIAASATATADAWVVPTEIATLRPPGAPPMAQMLYRFRDAATDRAVRADIATVAATLPTRAVATTQSYLTVKAHDTSRVAAFVPFVGAFSVLGLVLSMLIVVNVISGAVVAGYTRIGILKSIGFTPGQVVATYTGQGLLPAAAGSLAGVALGTVLARPLLAKAAVGYGVGVLGVPTWVDAAVPVGMCCLTGIAALLPALRAGRLSAVAAIAAGRAPRTGRGYTAHRLLGRLPLPRPVTLGLAAPFARPARTAMTLAAVLLGATAVTLAVGLNTSFGRIQDGFNLANTVQAHVFSAAACGAANGVPQASDGSLGSGQYLTPAQQHTIEAALRAQPATLHQVAEADTLATAPGLAKPIQITAYRGDARWMKHPMISGRWYTGPGQAVVPTAFLTRTGTRVGDTVTLTVNHRPVPVRLVGEVFAPNDVAFTDIATLTGAAPELAPDQYDIGLRPGTSDQAYAAAVTRTLGPGYAVVRGGGAVTTILMLRGLIGSLTLLLAIAAALGVLNTVVMQTRERVHDLGVFKAVGMTPAQSIAMVLCWVAGAGLAAGAIAIAAGIALHHLVLPSFAGTVGTRLPADFVDVYTGWESAALVLAGLVIAAVGALLPASWATRTPATVALHTE
jgi:putative ABC transport system permease protein